MRSDPPQNEYYHVWKFVLFLFYHVSPTMDIYIYKSRLRPQVRIISLPVIPAWQPGSNSVTVVPLSEGLWSTASIKRRSLFKHVTIPLIFTPTIQLSSTAVFFLLASHLPLSPKQRLVRIYFYVQVHWCVTLCGQKSIRLINPLHHRYRNTHASSRSLHRFTSASGDVLL